MKQMFAAGGPVRAVPPPPGAGLVHDTPAAPSIAPSGERELARLEHLLTIARDGLRSVLAASAESEDALRMQARARRALDRSDPEVRP